MAPEVLLSDEYNELADVWGLGITAYELAIGEPPHARLHSMRAALKIPQSAAPTLPDAHQWTHTFHDFIRQWSDRQRLRGREDEQPPTHPPTHLWRAALWLRVSLTKDPSHRPSAACLLLHPFVSHASPPSVLLPMIQASSRRAGEERAEPSATSTLTLRRPAMEATTVTTEPAREEARGRDRGASHDEHHSDHHDDAVTAPVIHEE